MSRHLRATLGPLTLVALLAGLPACRQLASYESAREDAGADLVVDGQRDFPAPDVFDPTLGPPRKPVAKGLIALTP